MELRTQKTVITVAAVLSLALWPVQISSAFGLPAHPLLLHVPVVFVPILGIAVLIAVARPSWFGTPLAAFAVVCLASTLITIGAGEALLENTPRLEGNQTVHDHGDAGETVRFCLILLTATLLGLLYVKQRAAVTALKVLAVLFALSAAGFTIRTGHLGAKLVWDDQEQLTESTR
jgi:uncharacterized membrane protein